MVLVQILCKLERICEGLKTKIQNSTPHKAISLPDTKRGNDDSKGSHGVTPKENQ